MTERFKFRYRAVTSLPTSKGVYVLCDLDHVPIYVGKSAEGIRKRVQRHLTSARSDIIANRQIDVWEIAWVWAYPCLDDGLRSLVEAELFHQFHPVSALMNGKVPLIPAAGLSVPERLEPVQVMPHELIEERRVLSERLPRQVDHYSQLIKHFLAVKDSKELRLSMEAHHERLTRYHARFLAEVGSAPIGSDD